MTFNEAMKELANGKKVRVRKWKGHHYIKMVDNGILDELGNYYSLRCYDYDRTDWELYKEPLTSYEAGDTLVGMGGYYKAIVVKQGSVYQLVNTSTWKVVADNIREQDLDDVVRRNGLSKKVG